jgi:hypothetical protein
MVQLQVIIFILAVITGIFVNIMKKNGLLVNNVQQEKLITVFCYFPGVINWNTLLWDFIKQSSTPSRLRFSVIIECGKIEEANITLDPLLKKHVFVSYEIKTKNSNLQKIKHFCNFIDDDKLIVYIDYRIKFCANWDDKIIATSKKNPKVVVSQAASNVGFPCYNKERNIRKFHTPTELNVVKSILLCEEIFFCTPELFVKLSNNEEEVMNNNYTPTIQIIQQNQELETYYNRNTVFVGLTEYSKLGIVDVNSEFECNVKFGSINAAKFALKFVT